MRLNFEISSKDYFDYQWYIARTSFLHKTVRFLITLLVFMISITVFNIAITNYTFSAFPALVMSVIVYVFLPVLQKNQLRKRVITTYEKRQNTTLFGSKTIFIDENGIREATTFLENKVDWDEVRRVVETDEQIFIILSSLNAFIIPSDSKNDIKSIVDEIQKYRPEVEYVKINNEE